MRILILTQKVDKEDDILGFFHAWLQEFSAVAEHVHVICLEEGTYDLPKNVEVHSLGKETGRSRIKYTLNFYKYIFNLRNQYDVVFVHMNYEYVLLGGFFWKLYKKKILLWYVHRQVTTGLRLANYFVDKVFTSTKQSFLIDTNKKVLVGHGIVYEKFFHEPKQYMSDPLVILHVGRITQIKNIDMLLRVVPLSPLATDGGASICTTRSIAPISMPRIFNTRKDWRK